MNPLENKSIAEAITIPVLLAPHEIAKKVATVNTRERPIAAR
jgi:hypothetical protein